MNTIRVALAQINPTVGDFNGNIEKIVNAITKAKENIGNSIIIYIGELYKKHYFTID